MNEAKISVKFNQIYGQSEQSFGKTDQPEFSESFLFHQKLD